MSATTFEPFPNTENLEYYRMFSALTPESGRVLEGIRDIEGYTITEGVRRVISIHKWQTDAHAAGSLLIAQASNRVEPLLQPAVALAEAIEPQGLRISVNPEVRDYVTGQLKDDSMESTLAFWQGVFEFYSDVRERQLLGARFYRIKGNLDWSEFQLDDPFGSSPAKPRRWRT